MAGPGWQQLTSREAAVLAAIGRRLTNAEIAEEFTISIRTVESHVAALRRKLGIDTRAKLISAAQARLGSAVPVPTNSFVGRDHDVASVSTLLHRDRWVTIVGPAGCGKTRLALELSASDRTRTPVVVELENATDETVATAIARAVGIGADSTGDPVGACGVALGAQPYMLVLDNCDRVSETVARTVRQLLTLVRSLTVLATSRSPLAASDETIHQLEPLDVEAAAALFVDRARSALPSRAAAGAGLDADLVAHICRTLDGLPLAIELAAARVRHLPLAELAERLDAGFAPLDRAGGASGRHRTLGAAFDWTWDLLDDEEQHVLASLAALPGPFDLSLAEAVTFDDADRVVFRLLDRSLISAATGIDDEEPTRFRLLHSLRAFVLDRSDTDQVRLVRAKHAAYASAVTSHLASRARRDDSAAADALARRSYADACAAIDWAVQEDPALAVSLCRDLAVMAEQYGPDVRCLSAIERAMRRLDVREHARAADLLPIGLVLCYGDLDLPAELADRALLIATDDASSLDAHHLVGYAFVYRHLPEQALEHFGLAERLADQLHRAWDLASVRQGIGMARRQPPYSNAEEAIAELERSMQLFAAAGHPMHVNNSRYMMAATAADAGLRVDDGVGWAEQCAEYARASGNWHELAHAELTRARLAHLQGSSEQDIDLVDALATFRAIGDLRCLTRTYLALADTASPTQRVALLDQALDVAHRAHDSGHQATILAQLAAARWEVGAFRDAAVALGELSAVVGDEEALAQVPPELAAALDQWSGAAAEGRARTR